MSVKSWSFSRISDFEQCKHRAWLKYDQRIPEPERTLKPGQTEFANDRGTRIHDSCEMFVSGVEDTLCEEATKYFGFHITLLRHLFAQGLVSVEGDWAHDEDWDPTDWKDGWLRLKLDALVFHGDHEATVIDYKSGRKFGNEYKHMQQLQLYALSTFLRYPKLEKISVQLWYIDQDEITAVSLTRAQALRFRDNFDRRGHALTDNKFWPPNPNKESCKWCPYKNTEHCEVGV